MKLTEQQLHSRNALAAHDGGLKKARDAGDHLDYCRRLMIQHKTHNSAAQFIAAKLDRDNAVAENRSKIQEVK